MPRPRRGWINVEGCGFVVVTSLLIVINDVFLLLVCKTLAPLGPSWMANPKFEQAVALIGSVMLVFFQWWLIEKITAQWFSTRKSGEPDRGP